MTRKISVFGAVAAFTVVTVTNVEGFAPPAASLVKSSRSSSSPMTIRLAEDTKPTESAFKPMEESSSSDDTATPADDDIPLEAAESLGRGSAKVKRGKRKSGSSAPSPSKAAAKLAPEEVHYEGPPAITETIIPTISILTVIGIIPAAAAWARQAWVRYKITTRRIRVTSGVNGKDMAEIVYPDIVEIRTVKRLFGDGDMVAFLRDGAKFEMRNIPDFDSTIEFILKQVDKDVADAYREKGDVTKG
eukprot:scaffold2334_cov118-Cylindrotheca_fusiformis.AAC.33